MHTIYIHNAYLKGYLTFCYGKILFSSLLYFHLYVPCENMRYVSIDNETDWLTFIDFFSFFFNKPKCSLTIDGDFNRTIIVILRSLWVKFVLRWLVAQIPLVFAHTLRILLRVIVATTTMVVGDYFSILWLIKLCSIMYIVQAELCRRSRYFFLSKARQMTPKQTLRRT